ncbi:MAG: succinyl-diaminopimelate desuccinylase [Proteobacteria bacterium]|nr:succinyl-diaminopimelate desuccinylase [Pseudomonadota bacterium]MDA1132328.1 succinyl-diaminopimelate desuccinylase [Pseudomonadota bacterium]
MAAVDPVELTTRMIRCPSVTPKDAGVLDVVAAELKRLGFKCTRLPFGDGAARVDNLFARRGHGAPHFCFAGHVDVVPPGDEAAWTTPPFAGDVRDGQIWGRGAADMKGAVACFVAAVARVDDIGDGSISLLLTGDEEGPGINGTVKVLEWMAEHGQVPDVALVGEPTNPAALGDAIKVGRRGSMTGRIRVRGTQGHVAYPHLADNPVPRIVALLAALTAAPLDTGSARFEASNLEITTVDVGNPANNIIPGAARAVFNIRFNDLHTSASLTELVRARMDATGHAYELEIEVSGESFLTEAGPFTDLITEAVRDVTGRAPEQSTAGGTSDARFLTRYCPVAEFGLVGQTMHKIDERVAVADLAALTDVYAAILRRFFATP